MRPVRLELSNFLAYRSPDPIQFEGLHVACLSGPNGAGKSSLLDAITWALWKKARVSEDDKLMHIGQSEMYVMFDFVQDGGLYRVWRTHSRRGKTSKSTLELQAFDGSDWHAISESQSIHDKQRQISELLRLDYETFIHSAFLQQGRADAFTATTPGRRKEILAEILGLSQWDKYEERAKKHLREIDTQLEVIRVSIDEKLQEEKREPELKAALDAAATTLEQAKTVLAEAQAAYEQYANVPMAVDALKVALDGHTNRADQLKKEVARIQADLDKNTARRDALGRVVADRERIEAEFARLLEAQHTDEALREKQEQLTALTDERTAKVHQLDKERTRLEAQGDSLMARIREHEQAAALVPKIQAELTAVQTELDALEQRKAEKELIAAEQQKLSAEAAALIERNKALRAEMDDLKLRLDVLESADEALCPVCYQPLGEEEFARLVEQYKTDGKTRGDAHRANDKRLREIETESKRHEAVIKDIDKALRQADKSQKQAGVLHEQLEKAQQSAQRLTDDQAAFDELAQIVQNNLFGVELRDAIAQLDEQIAVVGYDRASHAGAREMIKRLKPYADKKRELDDALKALPDLDEALASAEARKQECVGELHVAQAQIAAQQAQIEKMTAQREEAQRRKAIYEKRRSAEQNAREQFIACQQQLAAIEAARHRRDELQAQRHNLLGEQGVYVELREAFGKNGVPAMIIEAAIPELENMANELLTRMTDGRMNIRLDTQQAKKTGGVRETLDILISDELGTRDYDMFSGGEAFRVNFALRVALSEFLARRAGARLQTLIIDEGFGSQDSVGRERLIEAINAVRSEFDLILIVTHIEELRDAFPSLIEVRKGALGSELHIRS